MRSQLEFENELNAAKTEFDKETVKLKRIAELENELLRRQREDNFAALQAFKKVVANNQKRGAINNLLFKVQFCEFECVLSLDAVIAALEVETKKQQ